MVLLKRNIGGDEYIKVNNLHSTMVLLKREDEEDTESFRQIYIPL